MRGKRLLQFAAVAVATAMLAACTARHADAGASTTDATATAVPGPQDTDLAAVMERFYQQVEGEHWQFADGMLTPGFHTILGLDGVRPRYQDLWNLDVSLQQTGSSTVVAHLTARHRSDPARYSSYIETARLFYTEGRWEVDSIARRDLSPGTR